MAQKKSRPAPADSPESARGASTAIATKESVTGVRAAPSDIPITSADLVPQTAFKDTAVGSVLYRIFRIASSLQLALSLLSLFTTCLILATVIESAHSEKIAQELIYKTWWFTVLLFLLGTNIVCAALKKMDLKRLSEGSWPWKRYQTGFLVTHTGLITLVFGGLLTALRGEEGQVQMIDVPDARLQREFGVSQTSNILLMDQDHRITITRMPAELYEAMMRFAEQSPDEIEQFVQRITTEPLTKEMEGKGLRQWERDIQPGSFPWHDQPGFNVDLPGYVALLRGLAHPSRSEKFTIGSATLNISNFHPHTERWPYRPVDPRHAGLGFPAMQLHVESRLFSDNAERWVSGLSVAGVENLKDLSESFRNYLMRRLKTDVQSLDEEQQGISFEIFQALSEAHVREFLHPPTPRDPKLGPDGQLVLFVNGQEHRIPVDRKNLGKAIRLGDTDFTVTVTEIDNLLTLLFPELRRAPEEAMQIGHFPYVRFTLALGGESNECLVCARAPNIPLMLEKQVPGKLNPDEPTHEKQKPIAKVVAFYHYPDGLYHRKDLSGSVELLRGPSGDMHYRAFGAMGILSDYGRPLDPDRENVEYVLPWRDTIRTSFRPMGYVPDAISGQSAKPRNLTRLGAQAPPTLRATIYGALTVDGRDYPFEARMGPQATRVPTRNDVYFIHYLNIQKKLPFSLTLHRTWDTKHPGTARSATYNSNCTLNWTEDGDDKKQRIALFMNHTHDHGGYRFFQANFQSTHRNWTDPSLALLAGGPVGSMKLETSMIRKANISGIQLARDPGVMFKYAGTVIVVLGIAIMFYMKAYFFKPRARRPSPEPPALIAV